jgi:hypothetical protein
MANTDVIIALHVHWRHVTKLSLKDNYWLLKETDIILDLVLFRGRNYAPSVYRLFFESTRRFTLLLLKRSVDVDFKTGNKFHGIVG